MASLRAAVLGPGDPAAPATIRSVSRLEWVGRKAFDARYGHIPGLDYDFGMRWGPGGNQRLSFRRDPQPGNADHSPAEHALADQSTVGMLYAYDPTWDEYALLSSRIPETTVQFVVFEALRRDAHLPVEDLPRLLEAHLTEAQLTAAHLLEGHCVNPRRDIPARPRAIPASVPGHYAAGSAGRALEP